MCECGKVIKNKINFVFILLIFCNEIISFYLHSHCQNQFLFLIKVKEALNFFSLLGGECNRYRQNWENSGGGVDVQSNFLTYIIYRS